MILAWVRSATHELLGEFDGKGDDLFSKLGDERAGGVGESVEVDLVGELEQFCRTSLISKERCEGLALQTLHDPTDVGHHSSTHCERTISSHQ